VILALAVHVILVLAFTFGFDFKPEKPQLALPQIDIIKAEIIDGAAIEKAKAKKLA